MSITKRYFTSLFEQPLVGFVDLLNRDGLDVGRDAVLAAEVEHSLGLRDPADRASREAAPAHDQVEQPRRASGSSGAPTSVMVPSSRRSAR